MNSFPRYVYFGAFGRRIKFSRKFCSFPKIPLAVQHPVTVNGGLAVVVRRQSVVVRRRSAVVRRRSVVSSGGRQWPLVSGGGRWWSGGSPVVKGGSGG